MIKKLGVLLCYNDSDILPYVIENLLNSKHDLVVWDHGSDDGTADVLNRYNSELMERRFLPRSFDFYKIYQEMSKNIISNYSKNYDWVSWPDQDEILEGPKRDYSYADYVSNAFEMGYDYIEFNNINFWHTDMDDQELESPLERIRYYSIFPDCAPRIRSWRAKESNIRQFNHNPVGRYKYPSNFNLRHYPMRSKEQMLRRLNHDRKNLMRGKSNFHYKNMADNLGMLNISADSLIYDDSVSDLSYEVKYDWMKIYGPNIEGHKQNKAVQVLRKIMGLGVLK